MEASVIDRCLVGVWRQSGGGPLEYLRRRGVPITAAAISPLELSMNDDGTFSTGSVGMDVEMQTADNHGHVMRGEGAGTTDATRGRWSAEDGALQGCFDSGGQATGNTRLEAEGHVRNSPWNGGSMAGVSGGTTYTCSESTFTTSSPTRYGPMTYQFSRVAPPPGH